MQKIADYCFVSKKNGNLNEELLHCGKFFNVFLVRRSGLSSFLYPDRDSRCWSFLDECRSKFKSILLWANTDHASGSVVGAPEVSLNERAIWRLPADIHLEKLLRCESYLGWAVFFFDDVFIDVQKIPELMPTSAIELEKLANSINATVIVVSWYDDSEWLIVLRTNGKLGSE